MTAYWEFLLGALQEVLGKQLGQLVAEIFCVIVALAVVAPLYIILRAATNLRTSRDESAEGPVITAQLPNDPGVSPSLTPEVQTSVDVIASTPQPVAPSSTSTSFNVLSTALIMAAAGTFAAAMLLSRVNGPSNIVVLLPIIFAILPLVIISRSRFRTMLSINPSSGTRQILLKTTVSGGEPIVLRLDNDQLQRVRDRLSAGDDVDTVCRDIEPGYATWNLVKREIFRKAIEMVVKVKPV